MYMFEQSEDFKEYFRDMAAYYQKSCWDIQWGSKITPIWENNSENFEIKKTFDNGQNQFPHLNLQQLQGIANISQEELGRTQGFYKQYFQMHTVPPDHYVCSLCSRKGHFVKYCPQVQNQELTPYQGKKQCFGEFKCSNCCRQWISSKSWANVAQMCFRCANIVYPRKQWAISANLLGRY